MTSTSVTTRALVALAAILMLAACGEDDTGGDGSLYGAPHHDNTNEQSYNNNASHADAGSYAPDEDLHAGEDYEEWVENDFVDTAEENTSTFSIDVDNASYTLMRQDIRSGHLPASEGVRPEEYINFFDYDYAEPFDDEPFSVNMEIAPSEFGEDDLDLLRIGLQGKAVALEEMKPTNLVFLVDISGSMEGPKRLPLVKESLHALLDHLRPTDTVGIVVYASREGVELEPTPVSEREKIEEAIDGLRTAGATNAEDGIVTAYEMAEDAKIEGGNNRVIIATDGDFNVGLTGEALVDLVRDYRDKHISLTCLGYGRGNYNDATMESLARDGNGNYFYIDTAEEARRLFGSGLPSTLEVIASDVKIQVEFDETSVGRYRLVGYENRVMDNEDFDNDAKDAGEIGPGHTVTALYEIDLTPEANSSTGYLATVRMRYKSQYGEESQLIEHGIKMSQVDDSFADASDGFRFVAAVAEFAEILRGSKHSEGARFGEVEQIARDAAPSDDEAKQEFIELVGEAQTLWPE